ncbi:MAG: (2Fe-2S)-binding protein [Henriciella sp.]|uniref:(2Fe-2S)-binding protein n=1 Tax=Henriciella sp. TaxID=1968823 RepID=UPI002620793D|nr:(2Fe-2S)-binding protein [Henriciella sp.]
MIICICRRINDQGVQAAIEAGARSPEAVQAHHGCEFNCGKCRNTMGEMISESVDAMPANIPLVAAE